MINSKIEILLSYCLVIFKNKETNKFLTQQAIFWVEKQFRKYGLSFCEINSWIVIKTLIQECERSFLKLFPKGKHNQNFNSLVAKIFFKNRILSWWDSSELANTIYSNKQHFAAEPVFQISVIYQNYRFFEQKTWKISR